MTVLYLPALRGIIGDWVFYSCLMPFKELAARVHYPKEVHRSKGLSDMIQRELEEGRGKTIADYLLTQSERFFNSLVIGVYGGEPSWAAIDSISATKKAGIEMDAVPEVVTHSLGILILTGKEKLFALDGQHRLAGVKEAIGRPGFNENDEASVLLVGHKKTKAGLRRTRRLFTTLNKTAIPVSKGEVIALDEDDVAAVTVRGLVEETAYFAGDRIAYTATNSIPPQETTSLTTIGNLYDVVAHLIGKVLRNLPSVDPLVGITEPLRIQYRESVLEYFTLLAHHFDALRAYFESAAPQAVVSTNRGSFGGHVLFRPVGLLLAAEVIERLSKLYDLTESVRHFATLPVRLNEPPYADVLWDTGRQKVVWSGRTLARKLLLYMLGNNSQVPELARQYVARIGKTGNGLRHLRKLRKDRDLPLSAGTR
jgi:DNA sulfur modification protein DndB